MAMHGPDRTIRIRYFRAQGFQHISIQFRHAVTHRVSKINGGRAFFDDRLNHSAQKVHVRATAIFRAKLHIIRKLASKTHCLYRLFQHLVRRHA